MPIVGMTVVRLACTKKNTRRCESIIASTHNGKCLSDVLIEIRSGNISMLCDFVHGRRHYRTECDILECELIVITLLMLL